MLSPAETYSELARHLEALSPEDRDRLLRDLYDGPRRTDLPKPRRSRPLPTPRRDPKRPVVVVRVRTVS